MWLEGQRPTVQLSEHTPVQFRTKESPALGLSLLMRHLQVQTSIFCGFSYSGGLYLS